MVGACEATTCAPHVKARIIAATPVIIAFLRCFFIAQSFFRSGLENRGRETSSPPLMQTIRTPFSRW